MPVAGLNLVPEKVSRFSELSSEFEFLGSFASDVKVKPVYSRKGQNYIQRIFPPYSQHFTTLQISFEFSGFYYTSNSFLVKPIGKISLFEKFCRSGKEEARTWWSNVDRGPLKIGCKSYSLDQSDSEQHSTLR